jgi:hypothetical protein
MARDSQQKMELKEFAASVKGFSSLLHPDKIIHFAWYLHKHQNKESFDQTSIRTCYKELHMHAPNLSEQFKRLLAKSPKVILPNGSGFRLEHSIREKLDSKYGAHETTIAISKMLNDLPGKISDQAETLFLSEAIKCYHHKAFRAAIIMAWNLAYDHLLHWILKEPGRVLAFQSHIAGRVGPKKAAAIAITKREDFEELKESEVLDICGNAGLFASHNTKKILDIQLTKRNFAAHPSLMVIDGPQADDTISSLVNNVVLVLV